MKSTDIEQPLVSVIMPTYNHARFIGEAIESVLNQTYKSLELIIIDNYSEDNTEEIVRSFNESRIKYIKFHNNGIIAASRNIGLKSAKGNYIAFLDSDDIWLPHKLEKQVLFMEKNKDIFLTYSRCLVEENGKIKKVIPEKHSLKEGNVFKSLFLSNNFILCLTVMMRNKRESNRYYFDTDIGLKAIEDYDLWLSITLNEKIAFINEPLAIYRIHGKNTSAGFKAYHDRYKLIIRKHRQQVPGIVWIVKYLLFYIHISKLFSLFRV